MSSLLELFLFGNLDSLDPEMRPERVFGAQLIAMSFGVKVYDKTPPLVPGAAGIAAACDATPRVSNLVAGTPTVAQTRHFLRWLADSLDTDTPALQIEVVAADGNTKTIQEPVRRLAAQAFA